MKLSSRFIANFSLPQSVLDNLSQHQNITDYLDYRNIHHPMDVFTEQTGRITDSFNRIPGQAVDLMQRIGQGALDAGYNAGRNEKIWSHNLAEGVQNIGIGIKDRMDALGKGFNNIQGSIEQMQTPKISIPSRLGMPIPQELQAPGEAIPIKMKSRLTDLHLPEYAGGGFMTGAASRIPQYIKARKAATQAAREQVNNI